MMATTADNITVALRLAKAGFSVFPCQSGGAKAKQPMPFIRWRDASTMAEPQILQWWKKWPEAAVGIDLAKSGLIVIDADRHDPEKDGVEAFGRMMSENGFDPDSAPLVATPSAGNHHFFRQPPGKSFGNADSRQYRGVKLRDMGINVRGHGGYVIAPGTVMQDGSFYELFGDIGAAPVLPDWLASVLDAPEPVAQSVPCAVVDRTQHSDARIQAYCDAAIDAETRRTASAGEGSRNNTLNEAAFALGQLVGAGWVSEAEIVGLLENAAAECGLHASEARKTIRSGITAGRQQPRTLPEIADNTAEHAESARRLIENHDGTLADAETGEIVNTEIQVSRPATADIYPPGLVGAIARWIVATARRPQPELAIGAALAIVGTVAGRQFAGPTRSGTHLYVLGLAPTGTGKDHPLQQISRVMAAAKLGLHLGPSEFISMPAVVNFIMRKPLSVCPMDEFGGFMKRINSRRASGFESAISKVIRTLWSSSFAPYATPEWAQKESQTVYSPAITLFGASTPEQFYSAMEGASIEDGTLNRFLLLNGRDSAPEREPEGDPAIVPADIINDLQLIYFRSGEMSSAFRNDPNSDPAMAGQLREVAWSPDGAHARYKAFSSEVEGLVRQKAEQGAFYARTVEMALRIATIVAIGRLDDDQVRLSDLEYGIGLAMRSADLMVAGAADYMAENENQANAQKVLRIIKARGGRVSYRDLLQSLKNSIKPRDLRDLLALMHDAGQLERQEVKPQNGGHSAFWYQAI